MRVIAFKEKTAQIGDDDDILELGNIAWEFQQEQESEQETPKKPILYFVQMIRKDAGPLDEWNFVVKMTGSTETYPSQEDAEEVAKTLSASTPTHKFKVISSSGETDIPSVWINGKREGDHWQAPWSDENHGWFFVATQITEVMTNRYRGMENQGGNYAVTFVPRNHWNQNHRFNVDDDPELSRALRSMGCFNPTDPNSEQNLLAHEHILDPRQVALLEGDSRFSHNSSFEDYLRPWGVVRANRERQGVLPNENTTYVVVRRRRHGTNQQWVEMGRFRTLQQAQDQSNRLLLSPNARDFQVAINEENEPRNQFYAVVRRPRGTNQPWTRVVRYPNAQDAQAHAMRNNQDEEYEYEVHQDRGETSASDMNKLMVKEAMTKKDFMSTLVALMSFLMLPNEVKEETNVESWLAGRGGSMQTATQVAQALGKSNPKEISPSELRQAMKPAGKPHTVTTTPQIPVANLNEKQPQKAVQSQPKVKNSPVERSAYWQGRDTKYKGELNPTIQRNSENLMHRVNALLTELGIKSANVSSGWRPRSYNEKLRSQGVPAAKGSPHITGEAVDLADAGQTISRYVLKDPSILERHGLWMENPSRTKTWVHFDLGTGRDPSRNKDGSRRKNRIFNP